MPQYTITIPDTIHLVNPLTQAPLPDETAVVTFEAFLDRLFQNRIWNKTIKHIAAQLAIRNRLADARKNNHPAFTIAESDYEILKECISTPRIQLGHMDIDGFGYAPNLTTQVMPMCDAVLKAERLI